MGQITSTTQVRGLRDLLLKHGPLMISCREFEEFIIDYFEDDLPPRQRLVFDIHLKMCRECQDYLSAYCSVVDLTKRAYEKKEQFATEPAPEHLIEAILIARDA